MEYTLETTSYEIVNIAWHTDRGYFPRELFDCLRKQCPESDAEIFIAKIPEHIAWSLRELAEEDPCAYLNCINPHFSDPNIEIPFVERVENLLEEII